MTPLPNDPYRSTRPALFGRNWRILVYGGSPLYIMSDDKNCFRREPHPMFLRIDKLQIELPQTKEADPNAAAAVQELLGGRFGEMSTLMNYMYQSFNFRGRDKLRPCYELIANIAAEELGHIEPVSATINSLLNGSPTGDKDTTAPLAVGKNVRNTHHFIATGQTSLVGNSMGGHWNGDYVFSSGNLVL